MYFVVNSSEPDGILIPNYRFVSRYHYKIEGVDIDFSLKF